MTRKATKRDEPVPPATAKPRDPAKQFSPLPLALERVALRELSYREIPGITPSSLPTELTQTNLTIKINAQVMLSKDGCELRLNADLAPDPTYQPIEMRIAVSAFFRRIGDVSDEALLEFLQGPGVRIVFPYLRELVSSTTGRGVFPAVWIDPMGIGMLPGPVTAESAP